MKSQFLINWTNTLFLIEIQISLEKDKHETLSLLQRLGNTPKSQTEAFVEYTRDTHLPSSLCVHAKLL